jgi:hypothetical protein
MLHRGVPPAPGSTPETRIQEMHTGEPGIVSAVLRFGIQLWKRRLSPSRFVLAYPDPNPILWKRQWRAVAGVIVLAVLLSIVVFTVWAHTEAVKSDDKAEAEVRRQGGIP